MAKIEKKDCLSVDEAAETLSIGRPTLYTYINVLGIQRLKFPFDRKSYISREDIETIRKLMEENRG